MPSTKEVPPEVEAALDAAEAASNDVYEEREYLATGVGAVGGDPWDEPTIDRDAWVTAAVKILTKTLPLPEVRVRVFPPCMSSFVP